MEIFRIELEGIWQFGILEAQNSEFFFFRTPFCFVLRVSLSLLFSFLFFFSREIGDKTQLVPRLHNKHKR
jgi:putative Ca2+/H+ antiporter (TMEM165/GDT1 family)